MRTKRIARFLAMFLTAGAALASETGTEQKDTAPVQANWELATQWDPMSIYELLGSVSVSPNWIEGSELFWYRYLTSTGRHYWLVDPRLKTKTPLFARSKMATEITRLTGEPRKAEDLDLKDLVVEPEGYEFHFSLGEERFSYDRTTETLGSSGQAPTTDDLEEPWWNASPDGELGAFTRGHEVFVCDPRDACATEERVSTEGERGLSWGLDEVLVDDEDDEARPAPVAWSPDSRWFAINRADFRQVAETWLVEHLNEPTPSLRTIPYPLPGEAVPKHEIWIYKRETGAFSEVDVARWPDQHLDNFFASALWWSNDSATLYFIRQSRDYRAVDLCVVDVESGIVRTIVSERMPDQIYIKDLVQVPESSELLWWSMRDGWGHLYRYGTDGRLKNQVTQGEFNVDEVVHVDGRSGVVYFLANGREDGRNPYYRHLYSVNLDGSGLRLLTPEDATHDVEMNPTHTHFIDNLSRVDMPTRTVLRAVDGTRLLDIETSDTSKLDEAGWKPPEVFSIPSADGTTMQWGVIYKPFDFDPRRKYPIATRVYPGRFNEYIPRSFWPVNAETFLAQLGCIVVHFGNRGATYERGRVYREHGLDDFRDYGLADKRAVIEELARRHDFIDLDRVGIYGSSSGGFMALSAMLVDNDFYKVGVALAGPHDPQAYSNYWVERYAGVRQVPDGNSGYRWEPAPAAGNIEIADRLKGRLLLIHGGQDDVVLPVHLMRMTDALIKANKRFDMFIVPGADHSLGRWQYLYGLIWDYFAAHLIGDSRESADAILQP